MNDDAVITFLQQQNQALNEQVKSLTKQLEAMQTKLDLLLHKLYGKKSEKKKPISDDNNEPDKPPRDKNTTTTNSNTAKTTKKRQFPDNLRREVIKYDLTAEQKQCACGRTKHCIGKQITEQLDLIPAEIFVKEHQRYKYSCRCIGSTVEIASMPTQPIEKGIPGAGLLADIITSKFQDAMPLYRQVQRFKRHGVEISDTTMCDWLAECSMLLEPIAEEMKKNLLLDIKIHSDDTTVPVLAKGKTKQGRLWVYLTDGIHVPACTVYDYTPTRSQSGPIKFLGDYQGFLQADAYAGYDKLYSSGKIIEVGCMAHARRKFIDVSVAAKGASTADVAIEMIKVLYDIEAAAKVMSIRERYFYRKKRAKPILKKLKKWLNKIAPTLLPKTPIALAVQYMLNHWRALMNYLSHGALHIDNNIAERSMRPIAIGRKNYLFAGSDDGGKRAAVFYSIIETCKQHKVNLFEYLKDVLARIPNTKQKDIGSLLPYHWHRQHIVKKCA